jgi:hypothetical protein
MIIFGVPRASRSSITMRPLWLILPSASTILGDDVVTAGLHPVEDLFGVRTSGGPANWSRKPGIEVIAKVRLAQYLQPHPPMQISPQPFPAERLELPDERRRFAGMDTAALDRPRTATPTQRQNPTPPHSTPTRPAATTIQGSVSELTASLCLLPAEPTVCLTLRPFLHLGRNLAGAQERSRCSPPRRNDLDRAEHRHTINTRRYGRPHPRPT